MKRWKKAALITVGIMLLLAGLVAFVLPGIVKGQAVQRVEGAGSWSCSSSNSSM